MSLATRATFVGGLGHIPRYCYCLLYWRANSKSPTGCRFGALLRGLNLGGTNYWR